MEKPGSEVLFLDLRHYLNRSYRLRQRYEKGTSICTYTGVPIYLIGAKDFSSEGGKVFCVDFYSHNCHNMRYITECCVRSEGGKIGAQILRFLGLKSQFLIISRHQIWHEASFHQGAYFHWVKLVIKWVNKAVIKIK